MVVKNSADFSWLSNILLTSIPFLASHRPSQCYIHKTESSHISNKFCHQRTNNGTFHFGGFRIFVSLYFHFIYEYQDKNIQTARADVLENLRFMLDFFKRNPKFGQVKSILTRTFSRLFFLASSNPGCHKQTQY